MQNNLENAAIKQLYMQVFPNSHAVCNNGALGGGQYIKGFIQKPGEWSNGISQNDPLSYTACIEDGKYEEFNLFLFVKPTNEYMAFDTVALRKKTIKNVTPEKLLKRFHEIKAFIEAQAANWYLDLTDKV